MLSKSNSARSEYTYASILIWTDYTIHTFYLCLPCTIFCSQLLVPIQLRRSLNLSVHLSSLSYDKPRAES
jgi:hypothetical protein